MRPTLAVLDVPNCGVTDTVGLRYARHWPSVGTDSENIMAGKTAPMRNIGRWSIRKMPPRHSDLDCSDRTRSDSVFNRNVAMLPWVSPNGNYLGIRKFRFPRSFTEGMAFLGHHIGGVIRHCSKEQVIRIGASWDVAMVQNVRQVWDGAAIGNPSKSVRLAPLTFEAANSVGVVARCATHPNPAAGFRDALDAIFDVLLNFGKHDGLHKGIRKPVSVLWHGRAAKPFPGVQIVRREAVGV